MGLVNPSAPISLSLCLSRASVRSSLAVSLLLAMQSPGGGRGAEVYSSCAFDQDMYVAALLNASVALHLSRNRRIDFQVLYAGFNIKDAIGMNEDVP